MWRDASGRFVTTGRARLTSREVYRANKSSRDMAVRKWRAANPEKAQALSKRHYDKHVDWQRMLTILRKRGLTIDQYHSIAESQDFCCHLCNACVPLQVDHHHGNGAVRRMLCRQCNVGLGQFKESPRLLRAAAAYIERYEHHGA